ADNRTARNPASRWSMPPRSIDPPLRQARDRRSRQGKAPVRKATNGSSSELLFPSNHEIATQEGHGFRRRGVIEKIFRPALLAHGAADQENHLAGEPSHLA